MLGLVALLWLPLDDPALDAMRVLARSQWGRDDLDAAWQLAGWPAASGEPVSRAVYERDPFMIGAGDRRIGVLRDYGRGLTITGFLTDFAVFCGAAPSDQGIDLLLASADPCPGWQFDIQADRDSFDDVWEGSCQRAQRRLGRPPQQRGRHGRRWNHAVWRIGSRLLVIAQGEDFASCSLYDAAYLAVVDYPAGADLPAGNQVYDVLTSQQSH